MGGGYVGLITADKVIILRIFTASCVLLLMFYGCVKFKAAIHIDWKGLSVGIIESSLEILQREFYVRAEEIKVYIGRHICLCCYKLCCEMESEV